jgi:hypothetical protein
MLVILSPDSVESESVSDEVSFALDEQKTVIPVTYRDCTIPFRWRRLQRVDFRQDYARGLKELRKVLAPQQQSEHSAVGREARDMVDSGRPIDPQTQLEGEYRQLIEYAKTISYTMPTENIRQTILYLTEWVDYLKNKYGQRATEMRFNGSPELCNRLGQIQQDLRGAITNYIEMLISRVTYEAAMEDWRANVTKSLTVMRINVINGVIARRQQQFDISNRTRQLLADGIPFVYADLLAKLGY